SSLLQTLGGQCHAVALKHRRTYALHFPSVDLSCSLRHRRWRDLHRRQELLALRYEWLVGWSRTSGLREKRELQQENRLQAPPSVRCFHLAHRSSRHNPSQRPDRKSVV